jgi:D-beta-D-heptose 7-phosphate kinase/D-beta-D-heptose 1-phosphate adenosyltransferase
MEALELLQVLDCLEASRTLVLGDLLLDRYISGDAERISQEAPVLVLRADRQETRLGGAANVGHMLRGLEGKATCLGVVGCDDAGRELRQMLRDSGIDAELVLEDASRPTTVKQRFIGRAGGRHPNQILRVDHEVREPVAAEIESALIERIRQTVADHDCLVISDYGKGVCTPRVLREAITAARQAGIPVLVDPARNVDFRRYEGATLLKPNRVEAEAACGRPIRGSGDGLQAGLQLCRDLNVEMAVITLDRDGMALAYREGFGQAVPTRARAVYDITGAGDVVMAVLALCLGNRLSPEVAVHLGTLAGGLEVERAGVSVVSREELRCELRSQQQPGGQKMLGLPATLQMLQRHREHGQSIVLTNGCFDLLHVGHVTYLAEAAAMGDVLVVAINSDASVRKLKGDGRPVIRQEDRAAMLAALDCVAYVLIFDDDTPHRLLEQIRPDVLVKGGTYAPGEVVGREIVEAYGGQIRLAGVVDGISTTRIVKSLRGEQPIAAAKPSPNLAQRTGRGRSEVTGQQRTVSRDPPHETTANRSDPL